MTTHGNDSLSTCSRDPISAVCFSIVKLFLCGLQEFSRVSNGRLATTETKWKQGEERYQSEATEEGRHLMGDRHTKGTQK